MKKPSLIKALIDYKNNIFNEPMTFKESLQILTGITIPAIALCASLGIGINHYNEQRFQEYQDRINNQPALVTYEEDFPRPEIDNSEDDSFLISTKSLEKRVSKVIKTISEDPSRRIRTESVDDYYPDENLEEGEGGILIADLFVGLEPSILQYEHLDRLFKTHADKMFIGDVMEYPDHSLQESDFRDCYEQMGLDAMRELDSYNGIKIKSFNYEENGFTRQKIMILRTRRDKLVSAHIVHRSVWGDGHTQRSWDKSLYITPRGSAKVVDHDSGYEKNIPDSDSVYSHYKRSFDSLSLLNCLERMNLIN